MWGDKWKTSVNSRASRHPEWETRVGNKLEIRVKSCGPRHPDWETGAGDKWDISENSCGTRHAEWETSMGDKGETRRRQVENHAVQGTQSGRQLWDTSVGDKNGRQVKETSMGDKWEKSEYKLMRSQVSKVIDTCGKQVGDKCEIMRPKIYRVGDKCWRQVWETSVNSCGPRHPE